MPPLCTPEKTDVEESNFNRISIINKEDIQNQCNLYFTPPSRVRKHEHMSEYDRAEIANVLHNLPDIDRYFEILKIIGRGTFGTVFLANIKGDADKKRFALKHLIPTSHPRRIAFELKCMMNIGGLNNVAGVQLALRHQGNVVFVMPYQYHEPFSSYVHLMNFAETALYMQNLLIALAQVHRFKIIHRDIKPSNFLYNRKNKTFLLIDFGLAQEMHEINDKKNINTAKRKREPLSPISNILQPAKRLTLHTNNQNTNLATNKENQQHTSIRQIDFTKTHAQQLPHLTHTTWATNSLNIEGGRVQGDECRCYGKAKTCAQCRVRPEIKASRAGTPGYRPPEVLFKWPHQTTAVDVWAAGVILMSIISNSVNFFESPNDIVAIAELITLFGYEAMKKVACICGRFLISDEQKPKLDLRKMCCILRNRPNNHFTTSGVCVNCKQQLHVCICLGTPLHSSIKDEFPLEAYQLLMKLLDVNPNTRITAEDALKHPFFNLI